MKELPGLRVLKLHRELLVWLPLRVINDSDFNFTLLLIFFHSDELTHRHIIFASYRRTIVSLHPEADLLINPFLNRDGDIAITFRHFILQVLEADCLAFVLNVFLVHRRLPF